MRFVKRNRTAVASGTVLCVAATLLVAYVFSSEGHPVRQVDLNDGGVWVTSDRDGLFGRLNKPVGALDAAFYPPGGARASYQLDIGQDASAVVANDRSAGKLYPVDVARSMVIAEQGVAIGGGAQVQLAGGTLAVLDAVAGKVWAIRVDQRTGVSALNAVDPSAPPVATLDPAESADGAALAVGLDGTVHAVAASGKIATVTPAGGGFAETAYDNAGRAIKTPRATAVGGQLVVQDATSGALLLRDTWGRGPRDAVLQQPGPDSDAVVLTSPTSLIEVSLADGSTKSLYDKADGTPTAPVRLADCVHGAWAGKTGGYVRSCGGRPATPGNLKDLTALVKPVFRVNRSAIVLNDLATGAVWDLENQRKVDDWSTVKPPPVENPSDKEKNTDTSLAQDKPPKAVDDTLGARPGRTTVLHVLDNDSDPAGNILSISAITGADNPAAALTIAPDGQTVEVTLPEQSQDVHFKYTVDDGKGLNATAAVTVQARAADQNEPPAPRAGHEPKAWTVVSGGRLSLPVLADWRDFDGDPVVLVDASTKAGSVTTTPTGFLEYRAPATAGTNAVDYQVSDGRGEPAPGAEQVAVQDAAATTPVPPVAQPDVARGQTGQPVTVHPLDNDLPGADPITPAAELRLAAAPATPPGATVTTDLKTGAVVLTGAKPGTFLLDYTVAFGNAPFAKGSMRIDVIAAPSSPAPPVAMPDTAVLRGQQPAMVDVLANDFSPSGALLTVQQAGPAGATAQVEVAIVKGRWLRINALTPSLDPNPQLVRYSITDGGASRVDGEVSVTQLPPLADDTPVPTDDLAVVRAGDAVTVPVLDNDISPDGAPLSLLANVLGAPHPGQLTVATVTSDDDAEVGAAYVSGSLVRYIPPDTVDSQRTVQIEYVAQNADGDQATGHVQVTVNPAPTPDAPNQPPAPSSVEVRVVAGDTVTINVPISGIDPDGDSAAVTAITSPTQHGRVLSIGATSVTYQAFPTSAGTDRLGYLMSDTHGRTGEGQIQIAVVPPGDPQPPVAVDDVVTAAPGARLGVDVLANDLRSPDDVIEVEPLSERNPSLPDDVTSRDGFIELDVPEATGTPLVLTYAITNGLTEPSIATLTVRSQAEYNAPPVVGELFAEPEGKATTTTVDVLAKAGDPDGDGGELTVTSVFAARAEIDGGEVTVPVGEHPRTVAYEVTDGDGATAVGLIHVPAPDSGAPRVIPGKTIDVPADGEVTIALSDYVRVPSGKQARLTTTDRIWAAPSAGLSVRNEGERQLVLTAAKGYNGPAAITFEVTDGDSLTDPNGLSAVLTVPVQVGPHTPVLRCPAGPLTVIEGGPTVRVDVTSVCHVWVADRAALDDLRYTAEWQAQPAGVELDAGAGRTLEISAEGGAKPGETGTITVGVDGFDGVSGQLTVRVAAAAAPTVAPITVDGVKAGETRTVELVSYVRSQLRDPDISVISVAQTSGAAARVVPAGDSVELTPGQEAKGTLVFRVVVTDVADRARTDRTATGQITVRVLGVPDQPGTPSPGRTVQSRVVELSWSAPANNGAPVDFYEVAYDGGTQTCPASPCTVTGLTNGTSYTFTVRAHNLVGWSRPSERSAPAQPNTVPGAVTGLVTEDPQDGTLGLRWSAAPNDGTPIQRYEVSWTGGGQRTVPGGSTSTVATGLDNNAVHTFTVIAINTQGPGPAAVVTGQSAGAPTQPDAPTFTATDSADSSSRAVRVSWAPVGPNGPGPTTYTLSRTDDGGGSKTVCAATTATSCADDGLANDGTIYSYSVTAANGAAAADPGPHTSPASAPAQMEATATPGPITNLSATPTGSDGQATVRFDAPASHGRTNTVTCRWGGGNSCGTWTFPPGGQSGVSQTVSGLPNGQTVQLVLQTCNGSGGGAYAGNPCNAEAGADVTTYGPIRDLNIATSANGPVVNFTVSVNPNGKPATVQIQTSRQNQTFTTGTGAWSWSGSDDVGYSSSDTINVTVSDGVRAPVSQSRNQATPAPPPPPSTVTVYKAGPCGGGGGAPCGGGSCTHSSCAYIGVQTANFPGRVTCTFNSDHGPVGFVNESFGANERRQTRNWYGYPGERVYVTCGGVQGSMVWS